MHCTFAHHIQASCKQDSVQVVSVLMLVQLLTVTLADFSLPSCDIMCIGAMKMGSPSDNLCALQNPVVTALWVLTVFQVTFC